MKKILVIDDQQDILDNIADILEMENFDPIKAEDGLVGVKKAREHLPDLILCDINMPKLNGYEVYLDLHTDPNTSLIPFIFLTAYVDEGHVRKGMEMGVDDYLKKPFMPHVLLNAIRTQLQKHEAKQQLYQRQLEAMRSNIIHALPHELRTPLTGILGYTRMLIDDNVEKIEADRLRFMLNAIDRAGVRLQRLIENHLLYAQLEIASIQDKSSVKKYTSPGDLILKTEVARKMENAGRQKDLSLDASEEAEVQITEDSLRKIIDEIMDNAIKFSDAGKQIIVTAARNGKNYEIQIRDHGRGMTGEQIASIGAYMQFERRIYEQQGSGLGLVIARRLAKFHEGSLEVESLPDQGTTVIIRLPLANS